ncbi:MAG: hypothetical protein IT292_01210 [Deltaproteobacteria bacterium]|nr:hypothetical protein [Deltaproteobacteria bacterium]
MVGTFLEKLPTYPASQMILETGWSNGGDKIIVKNDFKIADLKEMLASVKIHSKAELLERNKAGLQEHLKELQEFMKANAKTNADFDAAKVVNTAAALKTLQ